MRSLSQEPPPEELDQRLRDYLVRFRNEVKLSLDVTNHLVVNANLPIRAHDGELRYFSRAIPPAITMPGFWGYENGSWQPLSIVEHLGAYDPHPQYVLEGYGGIVKTTDTNYGTIGSGAWTVVDNWDEGMLFTPKYVTQDVANSGLRFEEQGIYTIAGTLAISFTDTNQGRVFGVRLWNDTQGVAGREVQYAVGRNQEGVNISQSAILFEVGAPEVNNLIQIQIAGVGDSFANVAVVDALFSSTRVGL